MKCPSRRISGCCPAPAAAPWPGSSPASRHRSRSSPSRCSRGQLHCRRGASAPSRCRRHARLADRAGSPRRRLYQIQSCALAVGTSLQRRNGPAAGAHLQRQGDVGAVSRAGGRPHPARQQDRLHPHRWHAGLVGLREQGACDGVSGAIPALNHNKERVAQATLSSFICPSGAGRLQHQPFRLGKPGPCPACTPRWRSIFHSSPLSTPTAMTRVRVLAQPPPGCAPPSG